MNNKIELKSISELSGLNFFIPDYQRGYRWTKEQVNDLLDDVHEFIKEKQDGFYCIQPLVVKKNITNKEEYCLKLKELNHQDNNLIDSTEKLLNDYSQWEVIDGQQRLTTIFILLKRLLTKKEKIYSIEYETREDSKQFLENINHKQKEQNIDYHHIYEANLKISEWFEGKENYENEFLETILTKVKFIWYETVNEDPIKVFTRLNIGKIALTNSELVKALFLNRSNFETSDYHKIRLQQQEIASDWDKIEYNLQSDEFWLFLNEKGYDKPTRIDFILDLICSKNIFRLSEEEYNAIGDDEYRTFRYFYTWFKKGESPSIVDRWGEIKIIFQTFNEWFNDLELYHYIGFLVEQGEKIVDILDKWIEIGTKQQFIEGYLKKRIISKIRKSSDLEQEYDSKGKPNKTACRPLLLLHNIQTILNQGKELIKNEKYNLPVYYKFPFHLFKKESWDIEHIDSNIDNSLEDQKEQKEWLKATYLGISDEKIKKKISDFINDADESPKFEVLLEHITRSNTDKKLNEKDKNKIWNFCLLDASTNRSYGNSIFSAKRRAIIGKDQGKKIWVDDELKILEESGEVAFIPPCSKNVFMKYYNASTNNLRGWDKTDAQAYKENIEGVLSEFLLDTKGNDEQ